MKPTQHLTLYCHGLPGSAAEISRLIPSGVRSPTVIAPLDLEGFDRALSNAASKKAHVIGFSLGAMTALKIASLRPDQIRQVTLIAPAAPLELGDFLPHMAGKPVFKAAQKGALPFKLFTSFQALGVTLAAKPIISTMFAGSPKADMALLSDSEFYTALSDGLKSSLKRESKAYRNAVMTYVRPWADCLKTISSPVTIYHGTKDNWAPIKMSYALQADIMSEVKVIPLDGLGHYSALHDAMPKVLINMEIRRNDPTALPRFAALNAEWIEDLHYLEESDKLMVAHPEIYTQDGNHVFSAHIDGQVAGACALKKHQDGRYELTKMAVDSTFRGNGVGQQIMTAVESYAKNELGLDYLFLLSNTKNEAALRLYARNGWTVNHEGPHPVYARANIGMEKHL